VATCAAAAATTRSLAAAGNDTLYGDGFFGDRAHRAAAARQRPPHAAAGNDLLQGGGQSDTLNGGLGNDTLVGDGEDAPSGPDHFIFDVAPGSANADLIRIFESGSGQDPSRRRRHDRARASGNFHRERCALLRGRRGERRPRCR